MKKRVILLCTGIIIAIGILTVSYNYSSNTFVKDGVTYALTIDGTSVNSFPSKGMYRVDASCNNATGKWLYDEWKLAIEDIGSDNVTCDVDFTTISQTNLNDYIINLSGSEQGTGKIVNENGYRYEGKDPNNYILFNNELWRIIGVFDEESHGQSRQNLVKIIRNEPIGANVYSQPNYNDWTTSNLMNLLNEIYLNKQDGTDSEYCYINSDKVPGNCDYTVIGINDIYRPMIKEVTWHLGGHSTYSATADDFYTAERGTTVSSGRPTSWEGYIGLMYPSDYGYSVLESSCARTTNLDVYDNDDCAAKSWIYGQGMEWTITPYSANSYSVYRFRSNGKLYTDSAYQNFVLRPTLYLDSNVYVIDGNGSITDPYIIAD